MFGIIRMLLWLLVLGICTAIMKKYNLRCKKIQGIFLIVVCFALWIFSMLLPIENLFMNFETPEESFRYVNFEDVKMVVYGQDSALVVGKKNESTYLIVPKSKNGWKIGRGLDTKFISNKFVDGIIVSVYQYKATKEYFVEVENINGERCVLSHNRDSDFVVIEEKSNKKSIYRYYTYVHNLDENYIIKVNGKEVYIEKR